MGNAMTVEETFSYLNKQFGTMNIKQLSELPPLKNDIVSTGIMGLDIALGIGGKQNCIGCPAESGDVQEKLYSKTGMAFSFWMEYN